MDSDYQEDLSKILALSLKVESDWLTEIERDLRGIGIAVDWFTFGALTGNHQFADKLTTRTNKIWTGKRKKNLSDKMKIFWEEEKGESPAK